MGAAANAAAYLLLHSDRRLRDWQSEVDRHYPTILKANPAHPRAGEGIRVVYRRPRRLEAPKP